MAKSALLLLEEQGQRMRVQPLMTSGETDKDARVGRKGLDHGPLRWWRGDGGGGDHDWHHQQVKEGGPDNTLVLSQQQVFNYSGIKCFSEVDIVWILIEMSNSDEHWTEFTKLAEVVTGFFLSVLNIIMSKAYNLRLHQVKTNSCAAEMSDHQRSPSSILSCSHA